MKSFLVRQTICSSDRLNSPNKGRWFESRATLFSISVPRHLVLLYFLGLPIYPFCFSKRSLTIDVCAPSGGNRLPTLSDFTILQTFYMF